MSHVLKYLESQPSQNVLTEAWKLGLRFEIGMVLAQVFGTAAHTFHSAKQLQECPQAEMACTNVLLALTEKPATGGYTVVSKGKYQFSDMRYVHLQTPEGVELNATYYIDRMNIAVFIE
jgi:hypothetical protein